MRPQQRFFALILLAAAGCKSGATFHGGTPNFYPTAQQNYEFALKELKAGDWVTAQSFFARVSTNFSFSKWATLAELGIADCDLGRDKYNEAIEGFKTFIKAHPSNERTLDGYAAFKIGQAYVKQIPGDWLLSPPSYEKDLGPVTEAMNEMGTFAEQYPKSPYIAEAKKMLAECIRRMADHELYVARFYLDRDKPYAAIGRLESLVKKYPGAQREPETLLLLGKTYLKMNKLGEARVAFEKLAADYPEDYRSGKAKLYLDYITKKGS
jgi:outer membrane protein assembly factor BamD